MSGLQKVLTFIRCPFCGSWVYLGKFETNSIQNKLEDGLDIPFEVDYRIGGGRGKGWKSQVRRRRLPNSLKEAYDHFLQKTRDVQLLLMEASTKKKEHPRRSLSGFQHPNQEVKIQTYKCTNCKYPLQVYHIDFKKYRKVLMCQRCGLYHHYKKNLVGRWKLQRVAKMN